MTRCIRKTTSHSWRVPARRSHRGPRPYRRRCPPAPIPADVPSHIGRYRVERLLGEGGMGAVYLAHDPQLDRQVALKVPRLTGTQADARFLREARAAAALRHPNICQIHDLGEADGQRTCAWLTSGGNH